MTRISIITAACNAGPWITETAQSVLSQSVPEWEWIVVDDGSTDNTADIIGGLSERDNRILLVKQGNTGQGFARNAGLKLAKGEYVFYLDGDDILSADYCKDAMGYLDAHPGCVVYYAKSSRFGYRGSFDPGWVVWRGYFGMLRNNSIYISAVHRREDALRIGGFTVTRGYEDWDYWIRLLAENPDGVHFAPDKQGLTYRERMEGACAGDIKNDYVLRRAIRRRNREIFDRFRARDTIDDRKVLIVIPYLAEGAQGDELKWCLRGWREHFLNKHLIAVVGDKPGEGIIQGRDYDVFIPCPRIGEVEGQYLPHLDMVHKFRAVKKELETNLDLKDVERKGFVYCCDDMYAVNDFAVEDVLVPKVNNPEMLNEMTPRNSWERDEAKTKKWLKERRYPTRCWICHLPVYFEWDKWEEVVRMLGADKQSYVVEEVYYNTYYSMRPAVCLKEANPYRTRVERPDFDVNKFRRFMKERIWVCNSVEGYTPTLEKTLDNYYGLNKT